MRRTGFRVLGIGLLHAGLYLYVVPFLIYPRFGEQGAGLAVALAVLVSLAVMGPLGADTIKKLTRRSNNDR